MQNNIQKRLVDMAPGSDLRPRVRLTSGEPSICIRQQPLRQFTNANLTIHDLKMECIFIAIKGFRTSLNDDAPMRNFKSAMMVLLFVEIANSIRRKMTVVKPPLNRHLYSLRGPEIGLS